MGIPKSYPVVFTPRGLVDAYDSTAKFPGACRSLANLVFDPSNPEIVVSRPGVEDVATILSGYLNITGFVIIGGVVYGFISFEGVGTPPNVDYPFCYDLDAAGAINVSVPSGVASCPLTQATTGAWTPPQFAQVGNYVLCTHPGFTGGSRGYLGWFDISTPAAPVFNSGDLTTNPLGYPASSVMNYNNRAYWAGSLAAGVNNSNIIGYSDVLSPLVRTNANQALTIGDKSAITALSGLPATTTSGGVVSAGIVFKKSQIWQITGDPTTLNLSLNFLSLTIGTDAPRSVAVSPFGIYFKGATQPYIINPIGALLPVTSTPDNMVPDIVAPWARASTPSRIAAAYSGSTYRICMATVVDGAAATNDYWFDEKRRRWTGPHSFSYDCAGQWGATFILCKNGISSKLIQSDVTADASTVYTDRGTAFASTLISATFPKTGNMNMKQVVESMQELSSPTSGQVAYSITAQDEQGGTLNTLALTTHTGTGTVPHTYSLKWTSPLVFQKMAIKIVATASTGVQIGTHHSRWQDLGYMNLTTTNSL